MYLFLHIPKTAGTSLREPLLANFPKEDVSFVYEPGDVGEKLQKALGERKRLIYGHIDFGHLAGAKGWEGYQLLTFLRHPVERCISTYIHLRNDQRPERQKEKWVGISFQDYLKTPFGNNWMCQYLSGNKNDWNAISDTASLFLSAKANLGKMAWLGVTERYDDSLISLGEFMNMKLAFSKANITRDPELKETLKKSFTDEILARNEGDLKLWELANLRLDAQLELVSFLKLKKLRQKLRPGMGK